MRSQDVLAQSELALFKFHLGSNCTPTIARLSKYRRCCSAKVKVHLLRNHKIQSYAKVLISQWKYLNTSKVNVPLSYSLQVLKLNSAKNTSLSWMMCYLFRCHWCRRLYMNILMVKLLWISRHIHEWFQTQHSESMHCGRRFKAFSFFWMLSKKLM